MVQVTIPWRSGGRVRGVRVEFWGIAFVCRGLVERMLVCRRSNTAETADDSGLKRVIKTRVLCARNSNRPRPFYPQIACAAVFSW